MSGFDETVQSPLVGRVLAGRYRLVALIARGGMAEVWEGYDGVLSRPVAIKVLRPDLAADEVFRERFRREAITAARLAHPGIVATFDTGVDDRTAFIVMELVRGRNLRQLLDEEDGLEPWRAVSIASQIADALEHSHQAGLIHRDVKPANVLILEDGSFGPRVKVTDFGIAKAGVDSGADLTRTGMVLGTPKYLSPEQIRGIDPDARADLYSLGVVLYEMLVGAPPFKGENDMATALAHLSERPPKPSASVRGIPPKLDRLVVDLLSKNPARRVQTAVEIRQRLDGLGLTPPRAGHDSGRGAEPGRLLGRRRDHTPRGGVFDGTRRSLGSGPRPPYSPPPHGGSGAVPVGPPHAPSPGFTPPSGSVPRSGAAPSPAAARAGEAAAASGPGTSASSRHDQAMPVRHDPLPPSPPVRHDPAVTRIDGGLGDAAAMRPVEETQSSDLGDHTRQWPGPGSGGAGGSGAASRRGVGPADAAAWSHPRRHQRSERTAGLVVLALVVVGIVVAASLLSGGSGKGHGGGQPASAAGVNDAIESVAVYMANNRPPDNPNDTTLTFDGNPSTFWSTDQYHDPTFSGLYPGIGLEIVLHSAATLRDLAVTSATQGWSASAYVSATPVTSGQAVSAWGSPTDAKASIAGDTVLSLGGRRGQYVLLWITNLGPADQAEVAELKVSAG